MNSEVWAQMLRVRAWYLVFKVATACANQVSLLEVRNLLIEALEAVDRAEEANHGS